MKELAQQRRTAKAQSGSATFGSLGTLGSLGTSLGALQATLSDDAALQRPAGGYRTSQSELCIALPCLALPCLALPCSPPSAAAKGRSGEVSGKSHAALCCSAALAMLRELASVQCKLTQPTLSVGNAHLSLGA